MAHLTQQHILLHLKTVWADALGIDEDEVTVCPDDNLIDWLKSLGSAVYDELDFADVHYRLDRELGTKASLEEFSRFVRGDISNPQEWERVVKPTLTLGRFADWIAQHTPIPSYAPLNLFGRPCREAGTFLAIEEVVQDVVPGKPRFAPSAKIRRTINGRQLGLVWRRLQFHSGDGIPPLRWPFERLGIGLVLLGSGIAGFSFLPIVRTELAGIGVVLVICGLAVRRVGNPLPANIKTFKELSSEVTPAIKDLKLH